MFTNTGYESGLFRLLVGLINLYFLLDSFEFFFKRRNLIKNLHVKLGRVFSITIPMNIILPSFWILSNSFIVIFKNLQLIVITATLNTALLYYITIFKRHTGNLRGLGAPGNFLFMLNLSNLAFALGSIYGKQTVVFIANLIIIELGFIFIVSGVYKLNSGYLQNRGIEVGLYNPMWNYFAKLWMRFKRNSVMHRSFNLIGIWGEIIAGILMVSVKWNFVGAGIILFMFLGIGFLVRLGTIVPSLLVLVFSNKISIYYTSTKPDNDNPFNILSSFVMLILLFNFVAYLFMNYNFYSRKSFRIRSIQLLIDKYIKFSGIVLWRVFTADITSIYVEISNKHGTLTKWKGRTLKRWNCVLESISLVSVITTLKYTFGKEEFLSRLENYLKTLVNNEPITIIIYFINTESGYPKFEESLKIEIIGSRIELHEGFAYLKLIEAEPASKIYRNSKLGSYNREH